VIRFIYNLLWPIGLLLFLPRYLFKMFRRGGYRTKFGQRLGWYDTDVRLRLAEQRSTWLHAVSVGEVAIALKLAKALRDLEPDLRCVLTTTTTTGFAFASKSAWPWIEVMYSPLDFWPIIRGAFELVQPARIILVEAEVWPNFVAIAHARRIPVALVNARLSPRSERRLHRFRFFVVPTFQLLDLLCAQQPEDADRWAAIGVRHDRIHVVGSIKYDPANISIDPTIPQKILRDLRLENSLVLLCGSTHRGEEEALARISRDLRAQFPDIFLIIAPRHIERAGEIRRTLEQLGLRVVLRSRLGDTNVPPDCLLIDSTGELRDWYAVATVVFVGKSLTAHGGQNPVEAIAAGKPVVFGPHMENFAALARALLEKRGAIRVSSTIELQEAIVDLLRDDTLRGNLAANARTVLEKHRGATARTAQLISEIQA
jgi:3-deoxy-D-manno-octulosonic-acid transferase